MTDKENYQELAQQALHAMDALLEKLHGGEGLRAFVEARGVLADYVQQGTIKPDKALQVQIPPVGGVTLVRGGQRFTINDDELEPVRESINVRRREIRKRERAAEKAHQSK